MACAVAACKDIGIRALAVVIHQNTVTAIEPAGGRKLLIRHHANADDHRVGSKLRRCEPHTFDTVRCR